MLQKIEEKLHSALLRPKSETNQGVFQADKSERLRRANKEVLKHQAPGRNDSFTALSKWGALPVPLRGSQNQNVQSSGYVRLEWKEGGGQWCLAFIERVEPDRGEDEDRISTAFGRGWRPWEPTPCPALPVGCILKSLSVLDINSV